MARGFPFRFPWVWGELWANPLDFPFAPTVRLPGQGIVSPNQVVVIHTYNGIQVYQFLPQHQSQLNWTRVLRDVSNATLTVPMSRRDIDLTPWLHWMSVWDADGNDLLWSGPIKNISGGRTSTTIKAVDVAGLNEKTWVPITKRWDAVDPSTPAGELWRAMIEGKNLNIAPVVRPDPQGGRYDFAVKTKEKLLTATMAELVALGLKWTVVAGVPVLGPAPLKPVAQLGERDFLDDGIQLVRDGSLTANVVLLRGADVSQTARVEVGGLNLQSIVNIDSMFGVSNVSNALRQYLKYVSSARDSLSVPGGAVLHPSAPVHISELIPSARFALEAFDILTLMELESVSVTTSSGASTVGVALEAVTDDDPELLDITNQKGQVRSS